MTACNGVQVISKKHGQLDAGRGECDQLLRGAITVARQMGPANNCTAVKSYEHAPFLASARDRRTSFMAARQPQLYSTKAHNSR